MITAAISAFPDSLVKQLRPHKSVSPNTVNGKVTRKAYKTIRSREYLTTEEIEILMQSAKETGRHGHRDKTLSLIAYRHAFRVSELVALALGHGGSKEGLAARIPTQEWH